MSPAPGASSEKLRSLQLEGALRRVRHDLESAPEGREGIFHHRGDNWIDFAGDEAVVLEAAEGLREHLL